MSDVRVHCDGCRDEKCMGRDITLRTDEAKVSRTLDIIEWLRESGDAGRDDIAALIERRFLSRV